MSFFFHVITQQKKFDGAYGLNKRRICWVITWNYDKMILNSWFGNNVKSNLHFILASCDDPRRDDQSMYWKRHTKDNMPLKPAHALRASTTSSVSSASDSFTLLKGKVDTIVRWILSPLVALTTSEGEVVTNDLHHLGRLYPLHCAATGVATVVDMRANTFPNILMVVFRIAVA